MSKSLLITILHFSVILQIHANNYNFSNLKWGTSQDEVVETLEKKYEIIRNDKGLATIFKGSFIGEQLFGFAKYNENGLAGVNIFLIDGDSKSQKGYSWIGARIVYDKLADALTNKYGEPRVLENFGSPYFEGDGYEEQAFRKQQAVWAKHWPQKPDTTTLLSLSIGKMIIGDMYFAVLINYQSDENVAENKKSEKEDLNDL